MPQIPVENALTEADRTITYVRERLPEGFKAKSKGLTELTALRTDIETTIQNEATTGQVHDKARVARNATIDDLHDFQVACRRVVAAEFGTDSPEYAAIPWAAGESHATPAQKDQPEK